MSGLREISQEDLNRIEKSGRRAIRKGNRVFTDEPAPNSPKEDGPSNTTIIKTEVVTVRDSDQTVKVVKEVTDKLSSLVEKSDTNQRQLAVLVKELIDNQRGAFDVTIERDSNDLLKRAVIRPIT